MLKYYAQNPIERAALEGSHTGLSNKSVFNPEILNNKYVDMFKCLVVADLEELPIKKYMNIVTLKKRYYAFGGQKTYRTGGGGSIIY